MILFYIILTLLFIAFSLRYRWWRIPKSYNQARVLMYHSIGEHNENRKHNKWTVLSKDFEQQMQWFSKNGWQSFTISELVALESIPKKSFVITFDDGFEDNYINAFNILKKYGFKATIYLVPHHETNSWEGNKSLLNKEQILEMQDSNLVEFGSHTMSHKNLLTLGSDDEIIKELQESKKEIEKITGKECFAFAYPYGKYSDKIIQLVRHSGYKNATIVKRGFFARGDNVFEIKRIGILGTESFFDFYLKITRGRNKF